MDNAISITVGRQPSCDIVLEDKSISRKHAFVHVKYYDDVEIEDAGSNNGTFINDRRIMKFRWKAGDSIRMGSLELNATEFFKDVFAAYKEKKTDFHREFTELLPVFREYQRKLDSLDSGPKGPLLLKIGLGLIVVIGLIVFYDQIDQRLFYPMIIIAGFIPILGSLLNSTGKRRRERAKLRLEYEPKLKCPKCGYSMILQHHAYWEGHGKCANENCNAVYIKPS